MVLAHPPQLLSQNNNFNNKYNYKYSNSYICKYSSIRDNNKNKFC